MSTDTTATVDQWADDDPRWFGEQGEPTATVVVMGGHYWGSGPTVEAAKKNFRKQGGTLSNGYGVLLFDAETEFLGVDDLGRYSWNGNAPTDISRGSRA